MGILLGKFSPCTLGFTLFSGPGFRLSYIFTWRVFYTVRLGLVTLPLGLEALEPTYFIPAGPFNWDHHYDLQKKNNRGCWKKPTRHLLMYGTRGAWINQTQKCTRMVPQGRLHAGHGRTTKMCEVSIAQRRAWSNEEPSAHGKREEAMFAQGPGARDVFFFHNFFLKTDKAVGVAKER